jgi:hypothetical protein
LPFSAFSTISAVVVEFERAFEVRGGGFGHFFGRGFIGRIRRPAVLFRRLIFLPFGGNVFGASHIFESASRTERERADE